MSEPIEHIDADIRAALNAPGMSTRHMWPAGTNALASVLPCKPLFHGLRRWPRRQADAHPTQGRVTRVTSQKSVALRRRLRTGDHGQLPASQGGCSFQGRAGEFTSAARVVASRVKKRHHRHQT